MPENTNAPIDLTSYQRETILRFVQSMSDEAHARHLVDEERRFEFQQRAIVNAAKMLENAMKAAAALAASARALAQPTPPGARFSRARPAKVLTLVTPLKHKDGG